MGNSRKQALGRPLSRAAKETLSAAERLSMQIDDAVAASAGAATSQTDPESIEACADRVERAARDLSVALRELAEEKREAARGKARRHFGAWDSGDARSADNERIDRDLAGEYDNSR